MTEIKQDNISSNIDSSSIINSDLTIPYTYINKFSVIKLLINNLIGQENFLSRGGIINSDLTIPPQTDTRKARILLNQMREILNDLDNYDEVFKDELKSTVVLCGLRNGVVYLNGIKKIYPGKNIGSIHFVLSRLMSKDILEEIKEDSKEIFLYTTFIVRNSPHAGFTQAKNARFYRLTEEAKEVFTLLEPCLVESSIHVKQIDKIKETLNMTHRHLEDKVGNSDEWKNRAVKTLRPRIGTEDYERFLENWSTKILPKEGVNIGLDELDLLVRGKSE